jgi:FkbM family methyltransferase
MFKLLEIIKPEPIGIKEKDGYKYYIFNQPNPEDNSSEYTFEDEENVRQKFYYPHLKQGMHVLDVGAGYGSYTLPALQRGCKVAVITPIVPPPNNEHIKLRMNIDLNEYECDIINIAVHGSRGWINPNTKHFAQNKKEIIEVDKEGYVFCNKLDDIIYGQVNFIKMDIEGAEYEALRGAENLIKKYRPTMLIENHLFYDGQMEKKILHLILGWDIGYMARVQPYNTVSHTLFLQK